VDAFYQAYFTAYLILGTISAPTNPGNPYVGSKTQKSGITFGTSDAPATIAEMATRAGKGASFHKWIWRPRTGQADGDFALTASRCGITRGCTQLGRAADH